ncbi:MAG: hypothetical protein HOM55_04960 [Proteobacteria bacterium]|nr:hypothetical protein [Pseudomonadota bacterium]
MKEKLQKYALLAEIFSAIAVVASLMFVGFQIQQQSEETALNTRAIETAAYQDLIEQIGLINTLLIENKDFAELMLRGGINREAENGFESESDHLRYNSFVNLAVRHGDLAYRQYENGLIDESDLESVFAPLRSLMRVPNVRNRWNELVPGLNPAYVEYVNKLVENDQ